MLTVAEANRRFIASLAFLFVCLFVVLKQEVDHIWTGGWNAKVLANAKKLG